MTARVLEVLSLMFANTKVKVNKTLIADQGLYATDLAEYLVKKGVSFRKAHEIIGGLIRHVQDRNKKIADMTEGELKKISPFLGRKMVFLINPRQSIRVKISHGSTGIKSMAWQIRKWERILHE